MMKRPRSFISTLLILLSLATVTLGLTVQARDVHAGALPRLMDPRAGDPDEPSPSFLAPDQETKELPAIDSTGPVLRRTLGLNFVSAFLQFMQGLLLESTYGRKRR